MTLSELVIKFRTEHGLSQRQFAQACGLSNGFISMLEKNVNPNTGQPLVPGIVNLQKLADGMNMTLEHLFESIEDIPVDLGEPKIRKRNEDRWTIQLRKSVAEEIEGADPSDAQDAGIDLDHLQDVASGAYPVSLAEACYIAEQLGTTVDDLTHEKTVNQNTNSILTNGLSDLDLQLIGLLREISRDQKMFLLAQLKTLAHQNEEKEETPF